MFKQLPRVQPKIKQNRRHSERMVSAGAALTDAHTNGDIALIKQEKLTAPRR